LSLIALRSGSRIGSDCLFKLRPSDELLRRLSVIALELLGRGAQVCFRPFQLSACRRRLGGEVGRIESRKHFARFYACAQLCAPFNDLSADTKGQRRRIAGLDRTGQPG
jgi:hypothetical protein